jgi:hypothetical protein
MAGFRNSILGGINLIRAAIQSPNFVSGSQGWTVRQDGSAEFNNVVIRGGVIVGGTALYYNGTPAAGNLIMSIAAAAGTDSFGNAYVAGVGIYGTSDKLTVRNSGGDTAVLRADAPSGIADTPAPGLALSLASGDAAPGSLTEFDDTFTRGVYLRTSSPVADPTASEGSDYAAIRMTGRFHGSDPTIDMEANGAGSFIALNGMSVNPSGEITAYNQGNFHTFTPTVGNDGTATYSTRTGWWVQIGPMRYVCIYLVVNAAGSGTGIVTVSVPFNVDRTTRQTLAMHTESVGPNGSHIGNGQCVYFTGGSGGVADRLRTSSNDATNRDSNITGADLLAGGIIVIQGWLREAI